MKLGAVLEEINNYFDVSYERDDYEIGENTITGTFEETYVANQYIRIKNSLLNDGVYKITSVASGVLTVEETLIEEDGGRQILIYGLAIPRDLIDLATEIETNGEESNIQSESLGDHSIGYGEGASWTQQYRQSLNKWRKMRFMP